MYFGPVNKPIIILLAIFAIPLIVRDVVDFGYLVYMQQFPLVEGTIVRRQSIDRFGIPAGRLDVRVQPTNVMVVAITNHSELTNMPQSVRFHHSGSPGEEVFILGEENPIWTALMLGLLMVSLVVVRLLLKGRPGMEMVVE